MSTSNSDIFLDRAEQCARQAEDSELDNVRDRWLRSEAAWREMADRASRVKHERDKLAAEKSSEIIAFEHAND
ncbi:hypothetical protein [Novosphingobium album (ex Liu et al. 2023)]|uniref:Uncharacterized protein n=1 Tax=Novosphingobium album (ex Liu et al. 2023) TaxID=3031130 RepID=A0ABT5WSH0_9SPHN|nr:hypothetical protein [Novosphingobium album (ex Liu et al. 2023)]MDE8652989.1 hypothetical protein [Novosphingobium album (ex Liu et al. 2023)]